MVSITSEKTKFVLEKILKFLLYITNENVHNYKHTIHPSTLVGLRHNETEKMSNFNWQEFCVVKYTFNSILNQTGYKTFHKNYLSVSNKQE